MLSGCSTDNDWKKHLMNKTFKCFLIRIRLSHFRESHLVVQHIDFFNISLC